MIPFAMPSLDTVNRIIGTVLLVLAPIFTMLVCRKSSQRFTAQHPSVQARDMADEFITLLRLGKCAVHDRELSGIQLIVWIAAVSLIVALWY